MSARQAGFISGALRMRGALLTATALAAALALGGCAGAQRAEKKRDDASTYNTQLGIGYLHQDNIALAKQKLDRALKENPNNPEVHSARAMLFDRMGDSKKADEEFKVALRMAPDNPDLSNNYAVYLCQAGRATEGVHRFEDVARNALYRTPWVAYTNAGVCLRMAKRNEEAVKSFRLALQARPNFAEAAFQLGDLQLQNGDLAGARQVVDSYLGAFEETADLLLLGVRVARAQNDRVAAVIYARKLRLDFPKSAQAQALADLERNSG
jgi:type IV pilus assembly protein PilF